MFSYYWTKANIICSNITSANIFHALYDIHKAYKCSISYDYDTCLVQHISYCQCTMIDLLEWLDHRQPYILRTLKQRMSLQEQWQNDPWKDPSEDLAFELRCSRPSPVDMQTPHQQHFKEKKHTLRHCLASFAVQILYNAAYLLSSLCSV